MQQLSINTIEDFNALSLDDRERVVSFVCNVIIINGGKAADVDVRQIVPEDHIDLLEDMFIVNEVFDILVERVATEMFKCVGSIACNTIVGLESYCGKVRN